MTWLILLAATHVGVFLLGRRSAKDAFLDGYWLGRKTQVFYPQKFVRRH